MNSLIKNSAITTFTILIIRNKLREAIMKDRENIFLSTHKVILQGILKDEHIHLGSNLQIFLRASKYSSSSYAHQLLPRINVFPECFLLKSVDLCVWLIVEIGNQNFVKMLFEYSHVLTFQIPWIITQMPSCIYIPPNYPIAQLPNTPIAPVNQFFILQKQIFSKHLKKKINQTIG